MTAPLTKELRLPRLRAEARFEPSTFNAEARTVELRWLTAGAVVDRFPLFGEPYKLTFSMEPKAVRLERLAGGSAPLKADHRDELAAVVGVVETAWLAKDGGRARVRFSKRADVEPIFADVRDGILKAVSVEAVIHELRDVTEKGDREKRLLAVDWEPAAVALVSVPADPAAAMLAQGELHPCTLTRAAGATEKLNMADDLDTTDATADDIDDETEKPKTRAQLRAENAELRRREQIRRAAVSLSTGDVWAEKHIKAGTSFVDAWNVGVDEHRKRFPSIDNNIGFGDDYDSGPLLHARMADGLAAQIRGVEPSEMGRPFVGLGFTGVARELARRQRRDTWLWKGREGDARAVELALTTSDYPLILADSANKTLLPAYMAAPATFRQVCARRNFTDFRTQSFVQPGDFPLPLQVAEAGEIKQGYFGERKETGVLAVYGRILNFSRQALVNDDLGAFQQVMQSWGARMADHHNAVFFALLTSGAGLGPTMSDTGTLYNATATTTLGGHANYTSSGTAIADSSLNVGAAAMMNQRGGGSTGLGDGIFLNVQPRYLLAPPSKRLLAFQYTSANYVPAAPTSQNAFAGVLVPLLDANLSANKWYLFADPAVLPSFTYGTLDSEPGPRVATRAGFEVEGLQMKLAYDIGFACVEWRSTYANAGA